MHNVSGSGKHCHLQRLGQSMQRLGPCRGQLDCLPGICFCLHVSHTIKQTFMVVYYYLMGLAPRPQLPPLDVYSVMIITVIL